jgi:hypothetical protein
VRDVAMFTLGNGIQGIAIQDTTSEKMSITLNQYGGTFLQPTQKAGFASLAGKIFLDAGNIPTRTTYDLEVKYGLDIY